MSDGTPNESRNGSRGLVGLLLGLGLLSAWAYWPTLARIVDAWISNPDYTHGFLVVPLALWMLWVRKDRMPGVWPGVYWMGVGPLVLAGAVRFLAGRLYLPELDAWSIPLWIGGIVWLFFGWPLLRWALPSIAFLWFATPLPGTFEILLSTPLQKLAASLSATVLQMFGQPALAEGTTILLDEDVLDVERACSGLRMFYGMFALAYACVVITRPTLWKSLVILLCTAPIAIITNVARIVVTGLLLKFVSGAAAEKFSHDLAGLVMIPLAVVLFALVYLLLQSLSRRYATDAGGATAWLAKWAVGAAVLVGGLLLWANYQQERAIQTLSEAAHRLEQEEAYWEAIEYVGRYLIARPDDVEARVRLAVLYGKAASSPSEKLQSLRAARTAWQHDPNRFDLGLQAAQTAFDVQVYNTAINLCNRLAESAAEASIKQSATKLKADALHDLLQRGGATAEHTWQEAFEALDAAVRLPDFEVRQAAARAEVYRERLQEPSADERRQQADKWMDELVEGRSDSAAAWLARYQYRRRFPDYRNGEASDSADVDLTRAVEIARQSPNEAALMVFLTGAGRFQEQGASSKAEELLREAIAVAPKDYRPYAALAAVEQQRGTTQSRDEAIATLRQGITACGDDQLTLVLPLASLLAETGAFAEAEAQIAPMEELLPRIAGPQRGVFTLEVGLVRAQILNGREGPLAAIHWLRQLVDNPEVRLAQRERPDALARAWAMLGQLYRAMGAPDQAVAAFEQCTRIDPANAAWRQPSAQAALEAGNWDVAERQLESLAGIQPADAQVGLALAQIELARQVQRTASQQDWRRFNALVEQLKNAGAPADSLALLLAQQQMAQGNAEQAEELLEAATSEAPDSAALWQGLAVVRDAAGDPTGSLAAADRYAELTVDSVGSAVLRADLLAKQDRASDAQALLEQALAEADAAERPQLAEALARLHLGQAEADKAVEVLENAHRDAPKNLPLIDTLASLAARTSDWKAHERYEDWLRQAEGDSGSLWRAQRAERLLVNSTSTSDPAFQEAVRLSEDLRQARPYWWKSHYLQGEIAMRTGQEAAAIGAYEQAWGLGGRNILVADRLIELLTRRGRFDDAQQFVGQIGGVLDQSPQLFDRAIPFFAGGSAGDDAIRIAEEWVRLRAEDAQAQVRLGRVLMLAAQTGDEKQRAERMQQAEAHFQRALALAPTDVRPWVAAVVFYGRSTGSREKALAILRDLSEQAEIDELMRSYVLAQLYQGLGMATEAQAELLKAASLARADKNPQLAAEVLVRTANLYLDDAPSLAERFARQAIEVQPASREAKQVLVQALARREDSAALSEAFEVLAELQGNADPATQTAFQRRLHAALLYRRKASGDLDQALALLDGLLEKTPDDKLRLARLYEESGRLGPAFDLLDELARAPSPRPVDLAEFLRFWQANFIAKANAGGAEDQFVTRARQIYRLLGELPGQRAERLRWELRELKVRSGGEQISADAANQAVTSFLDDVEKLSDELERRQLVGQALAVLIRENASEAALRLASDPPAWLGDRDAITQLCIALITIRPDQFDHQATEQLVGKVAQEMPDDADLLRAIGDYHLVFEDFAGAVDLYRQAIDADPAQVITLNNLALALLEIPGKLAEVEQVLDQALALDPDNEDVLDTKAVLELVNHRPNAALEILDGLFDQGSGNPAFHLHQAIAYDMLDDSERAQQCYFRAIGLGIERQVLSPRDQQYLEMIGEKQNKVMLDK